MADSDVISYFGNSVSGDLLRLVCGFDPLGSGAGRTVYPCTLNEDWVIKVETTAGSFQNVKEWQIWEEMKDHLPVSRWLAPCHFISPCGTILIMSRTRRVSDHLYPDRLPKFLTDTKRSNYGLLGRKFVCHDYGTALLASWGPNTTRQTKVNWWDA